MLWTEHIRGKCEFSKAMLSYLARCFKNPRELLLPPRTPSGAASQPPSVNKSCVAALRALLIRCLGARGSSARRISRGFIRRRADYQASSKSLLWCMGPRCTVLECKICLVLPAAVTSAKQILRVCVLLSAGKPGLHFPRAERR